MASSPDPQVAVEGSSIRATRLETIRVGSLLAVLTLAAMGLRARQHASIFSDIVLALAVAAAVVGALAKRPLPWLGLAGVAGAVVANAVVLPDQWRADSSTAIFLLAYFGVVLLPRRWALAWLAAPVVLWAAVAPAAGIPVRVFDADVNVRWLSLLQLIASGLLLCAVWEPELEEAARRDRVTLDRERDRLEALQVQERVRVWRQMLIETHETVLNDIRYVLTAERPDVGRLSEQLRVRERGMTPVAPSPTVASIARSVAVAEQLDKVHLVGGDTRLERRQAEAFTAAFREVVRNAQRHAGLSTLRLRCQVEPDGVRIRIRHDQGLVPAVVEAGIGRALVIDGSLESIGGSTHVVADGIDMWIPKPPGETVDLDTVVTDVGRVVLSAVTVGNAVGGIGFAVALFAGSPSSTSAGALVAAVTATTLAAVAAARRSLSGPWAACATVAASAAAWLATKSADTCSWKEVAVIVAALSGFALCTALVWATRQRWWLLGLVWVAVMSWVSRTVPEGCTGTTNASFRAAALPAAFFGLITWSSHRTARVAHQRLAIQRGRIAELAAASAAVTASQGLQEAVDDATSIMVRVANRGVLDDDSRIRLRCLDAKIRAAVQVDPGLAGGIALAARELVDAASAAGVPIRVLTLRDAGDRTPVDPNLTSVILDLLCAADDGSAVMQVLTGPLEDVLVVTASSAAARRCGLEGSLLLEAGPDELSFDDADDPDVAVMFLRRSSSASTSNES